MQLHSDICVTAKKKYRTIPRKSSGSKNAMYSGDFCFLRCFYLTFSFLCYKIFYICTLCGLKYKGAVGIVYRIL